MLVHATATQATFFKYGEGEFTVAISRSCEADQAYIARWREARKTAVVLSVSVFQALPGGALVEAAEVRRETRVVDTPKWFSNLDREMITQKKAVQGTVRLPLNGHIYVDGLDDVLDRQSVGLIVAWPAGFHEYTTAAKTFRRVPRYTLTPP